jgi:hypothetical protein
MPCPSWVSRATSERPAAPAPALPSCIVRGTTVVLGGSVIGEVGRSSGTKGGADGVLSISICHCCASTACGATAAAANASAMAQ